MGTNYYVRSDDPDFEYPFGLTEQATDEGLHIGKSSMGWHFAMRVYPEQGIMSFTDMHYMVTIALINGAAIYDEYNQRQDFYWFFKWIREERKDNVTEDDLDRMKAGRHVTSDVELDKKNGLLMHSVYDGFCIGRHFQYPISYMAGEFC